jgi:hypothetical protein
MGHPFLGQSVEQGLGDVLLADDIGQGLGTPFTVKDLCNHAGCHLVSEIRAENPAKEQF